MVVLFLIFSQLAWAGSAPQTASSPNPRRLPKIKASTVIIPKTKMTAIVINPKAPPPPKTGPTSFQLTRRNGQLILSYVTKDPDLSFSPQHFFIELSAPSPLTVQPQTLTEANWPKNGTQVLIALKGTRPKSPGMITVIASYRVCSKKTRKCQKTKSESSLLL